MRIWKLVMGSWTALILLPGAGWAAETNPPVRVSVEQVVKDALVHNRVLQLAGEEKRVAAEREKQADAAAWPSLKLEARAGHYEGLEESALGPNLVIPEIADRYSAAVVLTQPLYTGGAVSGQKAAAYYQRQAADEGFLETASDVTLQAITAYWTWAKAVSAMGSFTSAVARLESHTRDVKNQFEARAATDNDRLTAEVMLDQTRLKLEEAMRRVGLARARLGFITGREAAETAAPDMGAEVTNAAAIPEASRLGKTEASRPEKTARQAERAAAQALLTAARADLQPRVSLMAHYEEANPNNLFFPPEEKWNSDAFAGVAVTWNIMDWGLARGRVNEARARARQAEIRVRLSEEKITLEIKEATVNLQNAIGRLQVADRMEKSARRNLEVARDLYGTRLIRHSELLDAHGRLTDAEYEAIAARADLQMARAGLDHSMGWLTERYLPDGLEKGPTYSRER